MFSPMAVAAYTPMFAATVIQYSVPAPVNGSASAHSSSTPMLNRRWRSDSAATHDDSPDACSAAIPAAAAARNDRNTAPAYTLAAPPCPPLVSSADTSISSRTNTPSSTSRSHHGLNRHRHPGAAASP